MNNDTPKCAIPGCGKPIKRCGLCYGHYMKQWRYGTPTPKFGPRWTDTRGQRFGTLVVADRVGPKWRCVCDCGETRIVSAGDLNRTGDRSTCGVAGKHLDPRPTYEVAHERVRAAKGSASLYECVDCGNPALHWSYDRNDPNELFGGLNRSANLMPYSTDPNHYVPRCVPCHKRFDLDAIAA